MTVIVLFTPVTANLGTGVDPATHSHWTLAGCLACIFLKNTAPFIYLSFLQLLLCFKKPEAG